ncbi:MAG: antiterminator Q family protein [Gammaproteobacteria bacterium]|nr:antiterminator Q family protein [Gammaproteobacteria bacterium]
MNEPFVKYVEERLQQWAEWYSRGNLFGLGYPSCSLEYRLMTEGIIVKTTGAKTLSSNEEAEEIEALVREMAHQNEKIALALRCQYFSCGTLRVKAKKLHISHNQFKYYVDLGHQWLAGRLSAKRVKLRWK